MGTKILKANARLKSRSGPVNARRSRRLITIALAVFLLAFAVSMSLMAAGMGVPAWSFGRPDAPG